jgi:hypothetical protein
VHPAKQFAKLGVPCAIIATNRSWTTFALLGEIDPVHVAAVLGAVVMRIDADDDLGSSVSFHAPDGWSAELTIELAPDDTTLTAADKKLFSELARRKILTALRITRLQAKLRLRKSRESWLAGDGLENELGVPNANPLWTPLTPEILAQQEPGAQLVTPANKPAKPKIKAIEPVKAATPAAIDRGVLAVHTYYWSNVFQMNGWKLYNRYKKHLPAERRREVDSLCNLIAMGGEPGELERAVENILSSVWSADDWAVAIRDPRLAADEWLDADQLAEWQRQLGSLPTSQPRPAGGRPKPR